MSAKSEVQADITFDEPTRDDSGDEIAPRRNRERLRCHHSRGRRIRLDLSLPKLVPLLQKIIATVVSDCSDKHPMDLRKLPYVRSIYRQFTAVGHDRLKLVHALTAHPQLGVHFRGAGKHRMKRLVLVGYMKRAR